MYNVLSREIGLSPATLASFYRHQKRPRRASLDKIRSWVEKENQKTDSQSEEGSASNFLTVNRSKNNFLGSSNIFSSNDGNGDNNDS
jgi:hypothetical protein